MRRCTEDEDRTRSQVFTTECQFLHKNAITSQYGVGHTIGWHDEGFTPKCTESIHYCHLTDYEYCVDRQIGPPSLIGSPRLSLRPARKESHSDWNCRSNCNECAQ